MDLLEELNEELPRLRKMANWTDALVIIEKRLPEIKKRAVDLERQAKKYALIAKMTELEELGLKRSEIAERLGVSKSTVTTHLGRKNKADE